MAKRPYILDQAYVDGAVAYVPTTRAAEDDGLKAALGAYKNFSLKPPSPQMKSFLKLIAESPKVVKFKTNIEDSLAAAFAPVGDQVAPAIELTAARPAGTKANPTGMSPTGPK